jgi:hypothetical protein
MQLGERRLEIDRVTHEPVPELTDVSKLLESRIGQPGLKVHSSSIDTIARVGGMASLPVDSVRHAAERRIRLLVISTLLDEQISLSARELPSCDAHCDLSPALDMDMLP